MKEFDDLWEVAGRLNGPEGCIWDQRQTFISLQTYVLEEAHEVVEAVDKGSDKEILEELGDLLYVVLFYAKVAEKEGRFSLHDILTSVKEKLIRRHPHVFDPSCSGRSEEEIVAHWHRIKKEVEGKKEDTVPETLPALAKAHKMVKKMKKNGEISLDKVEKVSEEQIADLLWDVVCQAEKSHVESEGALRRFLLNKGL